jgi:cellulose synthase/poly-beta-1,6-N-acetylglucosamine synthase-like glycosyltransferase
MLPSVPTEREKYAYLKQNKGPIYAIGLLSFSSLSAGMVLFTIHHPVFYFFWGFVVLTVIYLGISYIIGVCGQAFDFEEHQRVITTNPLYRPTVDVYLPNCGEDSEILENTFLNVALLEWPKELLKVFVLDDRGRPEVEALAQKYGFAYMSRPNKGELKKAGNLRYAFARTNGDLMVVFDADFAPRADFLRETVPYFAYDDKIAIIQTPQFFEILPDQPWVQKGSAYIQELFYRLIQVNRNTWGASICVGTNAVYRRRSLEPFGGTAPIAYSEDMHTGFTCLEAGEKVHYIPINLAKGLCPDSLQAYFTQQYRWCTGSTSLFFNRRFWEAPITPMVRFCYMSGMLFYIATAISVFVTPLPGILMAWFSPDHVFWYNCLFAIPSLFFGTFVMATWAKAPFGIYAIRIRQVSNWAHVFALFDKFRSNTMPWVPTGAVARPKAGTTFDKYRIAKFYWTIACTIAGFVGAGVHMTSWHDYNFYPLIFFNSLNFWLNMTILRDQ